MSSERQIAANRANSAKSTGPVSPEGRLKASGNSTRHGLLARAIVLDGESLNRFTLLLSTLQEEFQPATSVESTLVENMAVARWRQVRLWAMEKAGLNHEIRKQRSDTHTPEAADRDGATQAALAFRALSDTSRSLDLMHRYETRYDRQYSRALAQLRQLREKG